MSQIDSLMNERCVRNFIEEQFCWKQSIEASSFIKHLPYCFDSTKTALDTLPSYSLINLSIIALFHKSSMRPFFTFPAHQVMRFWVDPLYTLFLRLQVKEKKTHVRTPKPPFLDFTPLKSSSVRMLSISASVAALGIYSPIFFLVSYTTTKPAGETQNRNNPLVHPPGGLKAN